jgi:peptidoglycan/LPS O-acetylase OafA/YrhL
VAHRDDIQGLRAVAVLLVALGHAGVPFLRGGYVGVDVFFVLSGFLITGVLLTQFAERGCVSLAEFYARRARRILPAATLTLVVTVVAAHQLLNFVRAREAVWDSIWASLFGANIHFAREGSDYFEEGQPPSPVLHFWTLSVEEQFYLVWPSVVALALAGTLLGRRAKRRRHRSGAASAAALRRLLIVVLIGAIASLAWSIHYTGESPKAAYLSTFARAWELALGATLAIAAPTVMRLVKRRQVMLGWLGLAAIGCAAVLFSSSTAFPGVAALVPAVGAALVIASGVTAQESRRGAGRVLSLAPFRYVGDRSYAFYLWHWPVLIIAVQYAGHELSLGVKLLLLAGAFGLSIASYGLFENPLRRMRWPRPVGGLMWPASTAAVVVVSFVVLASIDKTAARLEPAAAAVAPRTLQSAAATPTRSRPKPLPAVVAAVRQAERGAPIPWPLTPPVDKLREEFYAFPAGCIPRDGQVSSKLCRLGSRRSWKTIVVFGDSHAQMWMPAILRMAQRDGWTVVPLVKQRCIPRTWMDGSGECSAWYRWARRHVTRLRPQVTLIVTSWASTFAPRRAIASVDSLSVATHKSSGRVIVLGDAPGQRREPVDCLLGRDATMRTCTNEPPAPALRATAAIAANARKRGIGFVDTEGWFCARGSRKRLLCPLVIDRTIAYFDRGHVSQTYVLRLASIFRAAFQRALFG